MISLPPNPTSRRVARMVAASAIVLVSAACSLPGRMLRGYAEAEPEGMELLEEGGAFHQASPALRGQVRFVHDDFGSLSTDGLETYGMPWKLVSAALVLDQHDRVGSPVNRDGLHDLLARYGFIQPRHISNWQGPQPRLDHPLGLVMGQARRGFPAVDVEVANLGCATCHAGPLFGPDGAVTDTAWLGLPNASINLGAYAAAAFSALRVQLNDPDRLMQAVHRVFPRTSEREASTLRKHLLPAVSEALAERDSLYGGLLPFENGGPGLSNGVASIGFLFGVLEPGPSVHQFAFVQAPDLTGTTMRHSLLVDGVHAPPGGQRFGDMSREDVSEEHLADLAAITSLFVVGTQGVTAEQARRAIPSVQDVMHFVDGVSSPRFPGQVDDELARAGEVLYRDQCASCHGTYSPGIDRPVLERHPNRLVVQDRMHTDSTRWSAVDQDLLAVLEEMGFGDALEPLQSNGYVAPDLSGIWATAPYLHNGSVPTLWHLMTPEERPVRFLTGGHRLDYSRMGIAGQVDQDGVYRYPEGYEPWSDPVLFDTRERGRSNAGHEFRNLTDEQKWALIEYMKVL